MTCDPAHPELTQLDQTLATKDNVLPDFKHALAAGTQRQREAFESGTNVTQLVGERADLIDALIIRAWKHCMQQTAERFALVAVGGYGRGQLHPGSDIDVMVLLPDARPGEDELALLGDFFTLLWDIGLEIGHSVRTVADCVNESSDVTVVTSLMESRTLYGDEALFDAMREQTDADKIWPARDFFEAKAAEQRARHLRYDDTGYNLEPNIKGSPGGLRDIQMVGWVAKRYFNAETLEDLVGQGFLTAAEFEGLCEGREYLWRLRYALHVLTGRREDRLLFDHQIVLAKQLGYRDAEHTLAVEQMMQRYYRTVLKLSRMNEMLLQLFDEAILRDNDDTTPLNERFNIVHGNIDLIDTTLFEREPGAMLEIFFHVQRQEQITGVTARTIRAIRRCRHLIDQSFRDDQDNQKMFLKIMDAKIGVTHELRRMNRYGVLGQYIPAFGRIVGRMQYDLFHAYTVDAHTLFVVSNLRRFALPRFNAEYPYCSQIMQNVPKPLIVYMAGLFHDIAKGRGGDHSELGAQDAETFCRQHNMSAYDARLVAWLVQHHLHLSITAQKKDVNDPQVINEFATLVGDQLHLDYLYLLTVADVRATNPKLFNSWKAQLFEKLYRQTRRVLDRGLSNPISRAELAAENRAEAQQLLDESGADSSLWQGTWQDLGEDYFLQHAATEIAWHTERLSELNDPARSLVAIKPTGDRGVMLLLWYAPQEDFGFARATATLDELGLNILDARITGTSNSYSLDTYRIMETVDNTIYDPARLEAIERQCRLAQSADENTPRVTRQAPRRARLFKTPTVLSFNDDTTRQRTVMEMTAADRPGLLSKVGAALRDCHVALHNAKITTVGERAENVFFLTGERGTALSDAQCTELQDGVLARLQGHGNAEPATTVSSR
ncbi:MAG: [protein-PII] uridylyltransferase [Gammaproteobacteria bacterium]